MGLVRQDPGRSETFRGLLNDLGALETGERTVKEDLI